MTNVSHKDFCKKESGQRLFSYFQLNTFLLLPSVWDKLEFFSQISINETSD